jgi:hypothetical protein
MSNSNTMDLAQSVLNTRPMRRGSFISSLLVALGLLLALCGAAYAGEVEDRLAKVARLEAQKASLERDRRAADTVYRQKTAEIAKLKAQPSSWGRDRKLQALLAESKDMASALDKKDEQIRAVAAQITTEKKAAVVAIDRELAANPGPSAERRAQLTQKRSALAGAQKPRKIKVADETIDPLDDPEDLEYKADALSVTEKQLLEEERRLERRASYYRKQAKLAKARTRADEQDIFRDDQPRRAGRGGGAQGALDPANEDNESPPPAEEPGAGASEDSDFGSGVTPPPVVDPTRDPGPTPDVTVDPSVVLADVVTSDTLDELRRAERSGDPEARAKAAERARKEVQARAERIKQRRLEMERRAKTLRQD